MSTAHAVPLVYLPLFVAAGLVIGAAYFVALRRHAHLFLEGGSPLRGAAYALARLAFAIATFWIIGHAGIVALLGSFAGFLAARAAIVLISRSYD